MDIVIQTAQLILAFYTTYLVYATIAHLWKE